MTDAIAAMDVGQLRTTLGQLLDLSAARAGTRPRPATRRRRRARQAYGLRLRVDLIGARPPVWRRLELPSTLFLDELHGLLQAVFGWTDSHLHRFTLGESAFSPEAEHFLCPFDVEEGEDDGVPARDVRLDETLAEVGDELRYTYDYGDNWLLLLTVERVLPARADVAVPDGRGGPAPEDVGGIHAWNAQRGRPASFDPEGTAEAVVQWERDRLLGPDLLSLRDQLSGTPRALALDRMIAEADLRDGPTDVDEVAARRLLEPYTWLLERVGHGVALTGAGYLPPAFVLAAMTELQLDPHWIGKGNREDLTVPFALLRHSAQDLGLLRKSKGRLLPSRAGLAVVGDTGALWLHVAGRLASPPADPFLAVAGALVLLRTAAGRRDDAQLAALLTSAGWRTAEGTAVTWLPRSLGSDVLTVLHSGERSAAAVSPELRALARCALRAPRR